MKKNLFLFALLFITSVAIAQVPNAINYQAVARNNTGAALATQTIKVRFSITRNAISQYSETRQVTTNSLGLFNVQIGSAGALVTTGSFTGINWTSNPQPLMLKVELDITNTNIFTDMGSQTFATVPYSFSSAEAINAINIGGNYVDTNTPQLNDILKWTGSAWAPASLPLAPSVYSVAGAIINIPFGGASAPWTNTGQFATVTVSNGQTITANFNGAVRQFSASIAPIAYSVCYEQVINAVPSGNIYSFQNTNFINVTVTAQPNYTILSATGAVKVVTGTTIPTANQIPPGTYRVFMGIKNNSTTNNLSSNDFVNGTIIVF